jgi:hypothetical protein
MASLGEMACLEGMEYLGDLLDLLDLLDQQDPKEQMAVTELLDLLDQQDPKEQMAVTELLDQLDQQGPAEQMAVTELLDQLDQQGPAEQMEVTELLDLLDQQGPAEQMDQLDLLDQLDQQDLTELLDPLGLLDPPEWTPPQVGVPTSGGGRGLARKSKAPRYSTLELLEERYTPKREVGPTTCACPWTQSTAATSLTQKEAKDLLQCTGQSTRRLVFLEHITTMSPVLCAMHPPDPLWL